MPPLAVAAWRLTLASLLMGLWPGARQPVELPARVVWLGGVLLAVHFASWIASLQMLPVYLSVCLVTTSPLWVALFSREATSPPALLLAFAGTVLISFQGLQTVRGVQPLGLFLALLGAFCMAGYLLWARRHQPAAGQTGYALRVYACAASLLMGGAVASSTPLWGYTPWQWGCLLGMALVPQLLGHTLLLLAVRHGSANWAALSILLEPVGSTLLAIWLLHEQIAGIQWLGLAMTLGGLAGLTIPGGRSAAG